MRGASIRVAGFLVLLALLVVPATTAAAPVITVSPTSGPAGTSFAPGTIVLFGGVDQPAEPVAAVPVVVAADSASLIAPVITVSPTSGPAGTNFAVAGTGFTPGSTVLFGAVDQAAQPVAATLLQVAADGGLQTAIDSTGFAPGEYTVVVGTSDASALLASAAFTVTAGGAGGGTGGPTTMPRSGGGGMSSGTGVARLLPLGPGIVALAIIGAVVAWRRRAHRSSAVTRIAGHRDPIPIW